MLQWIVVGLVMMTHPMIARRLRQVFVVVLQWIVVSDNDPSNDCLEDCAGEWGGIVFDCSGDVKRILKYGMKNIT